MREPACLEMKASPSGPKDPTSRVRSQFCRSHLPTRLIRASQPRGCAGATKPGETTPPRAACLRSSSGSAPAAEWESP